jgi:hypothetical protein
MQAHLAIMSLDTRVASGCVVMLAVLVDWSWAWQAMRGGTWRSATAS